jgi:NAD(P)H-hydrate repair Nnr-like enzyme with NAD(P)H-hydrate epimerase domain
LSAISGASSLINYSGKTVLSIDTPTGVRDYSQHLESHLAAKSEIYLKRREIENSENVVARSYLSLHEKYRHYIELAAERLKLIHTDNNQTA